MNNARLTSITILVLACPVWLAIALELLLTEPSPQDLGRDGNNSSPWKVWFITTASLLVIPLAFGLRRHFQPVKTFSSSGRIRKIFRRRTIAEVKPQSTATHSHPRSAAGRLTFNNFYKGVLDEINAPQPCLKEYVVSFSERDSMEHGKGNINGRHRHYDIKDKSRPEANDDIGGEHFVKCVDVDYYAQKDIFAKMRYYLGFGINVGLHAQPIMLYSFDPWTPAGVSNDGEMLWHWSKDGELNVEVIGGGRYRHGLNQWRRDTVSVFGWSSVVNYNVDTKRVDQHAYILLTPTYEINLFPFLGCLAARFYSIAYICCLRLEHANQLGRRVPVIGKTVGFSKIVSKEGETYHAVFRLGEPAVTLAKSESWMSVLKRTEIQNKGKLDYGITEKYLLSPQKLSEDQISVIIQCMEECGGLETTTDATPVHYAPQAIDTPTVNSTFPNTDDGKQGGARIGRTSPVDGAVLIADSRNSQAQSVQGRVLDLQEKTKSLKVTRSTNSIMNDFVKELRFPHLQAATLEEVRRRQPRPTQQTIIDRAEPWLHAHWLNKKKPTVTCFQKKEVYGKKTPARNISTLSPVLKVLYSMYTYPLTEHLQTFKWYAFGKKPMEIALRVQEVHTQGTSAEVVVETDFTRFDGYQNVVTRELERKVLAAAYPHDKNAEVFWRAGIDCMAYTQGGVKYNTGNTRLSGSPETAVFNTLVNAFSAYYFFRREGCSHEAAWSKLGVYGGDDGLTSCDPASTARYTAAALELGQVLKSTVVKHDGMTNFLGRIYPTPASSCDSIVDVRRVLQKINVTTSGGEDDWHKELFCKWDGIVRNAQHTPLVYHYAKRGLELLDKMGFNPHSLSEVDKFKWTNYWHRLHPGETYPSRTLEENVYTVVNILGISAYKYDAEIKRIASAQTVDELFDQTLVAF